MAKRKQRGRKSLEQAVRSTLATKKDKPNLIPGLLGAYVNGIPTKRVAGREDFIWVRLRGATSEVVQAFNDAVGLHFDLPILVYRDEVNPNIWRVYGRDIRAYADWEGVSYLPPHGDQHSFSGRDTSGIDPVWVNKRQYMPLLPRPHASGTMAVYLEPDYYYFDGAYHYWPGSGTSDLSTYLPTGTATARFVTIYINSAGNPDYIEGPEYSMIPPPPDIAEKIELPTAAQGVPIAAVRLYSGTYAINWGDIYDLRSPQSPLESTGSVLGIAEDGAYLGPAGILNFEGDLDVAISGSYAHISHNPTGTMAIYDESIYMGLADGLNFVGSSVEVVISGSTAHVMHTGTGGGGGGHETGTMVIYDEGAWLGVFEEMRFIGAGVQAFDSGSYAAIAITGSAASVDVPTTGTVVIYDESSLLGSFKEIRFAGDGVIATDEGDYAKVLITGSTSGGAGTGTYVRAGEAQPLATITGGYWKIPEGEYMTGTLSVGVNGVWQTPVDDYLETYPSSGVFTLLDSVPTGSYVSVIWGAPDTSSGGGGGGNGGGVDIYDDGALIQAGAEKITFDDGLTASVSGSYVSVVSAGSSSLDVYDNATGSVSGITAIDYEGGMGLTSTGTVAYVHGPEIHYGLVTGSRTITGDSTFYDVPAAVWFELEVESDLLAVFEGANETTSANWNYWDAQLELDNGDETSLDVFEWRIDTWQNTLENNYTHRTVFKNVGPGAHVVKAQVNARGDGKTLVIRPRGIITVLAVPVRRE